MILGTEGLAVLTSFGFSISDISTSDKKLRGRTLPSPFLIQNCSLLDGDFFPDNTPVLTDCRAYRETGDDNERSGENLDEAVEIRPGGR